MKYIATSSGWGTVLAANIVITALFHFTACTKPPVTNGNVPNTAVLGNSNAVLSATTPTPPPTPQPANILFIVDSSGSMKVKSGSKTKMDVAKTVVNELIAKLPAGTNAGLMAYGHRDRKNCEDVELLVPIGPVNSNTFSEKVNALQPIGQTPISYSIRQGADVLRSVTGKKTVILISDGEETCKEDPCAVAADLKKADVDLKVHVVGFGIDKEAARKQLTCIAEATGGVYKDAADAQQLKETLEGIARSEEAPAGDKGKLVVDHLDSYGKRVLWCVEVYPEGKTDIPSRVFESCSKDTATENAFEMTPGRYDIWVYGAKVMSKAGKQTVEIVAGRETRMPLEQSGRIFLNIVDRNGTAVQYVASASPLSDTIRAGGTFYSGERQELMPGTYDISMWGGPVSIPKKTGVVIKSGEETKIDITIDR